MSDDELIKRLRALRRDRMPTSTWLDAAADRIGHINLLEDGLTDQGRTIHRLRERIERIEESLGKDMTR